MEPLVSIIVPVYNVEALLPKCLDSILNQTYEHIEVLVVNDGSPDNSQSIIDDYAKKDERIKPLIKPNGGLSDARNFGMKYSNGSYYLFIDSDDWIRNDMVELMVNKVIETDCEIVTCDMEYVYESGERKFSSGGSYGVTSASEYPDILIQNHSACNKLIKKDLFDDVEFPKGLWYEDMATIPIVMAKAKSVAKVDEMLYFYWQREGSISHSADARVFDIYVAMKRIKDYLNEHHMTGFNEVVRMMYLLNGLNATNLRIKEYDDHHVEYLSKNLNLMNSHVNNWYSLKLIKEFSFKHFIIFTLMKLKMFSLVLFLYRK